MDAQTSPGSAAARGGGPEVPRPGDGGGPDFGAVFAAMPGLDLLLAADAERARDAAEAANAAKSQFLSTMSHELRTPLNAIGGYTDLLMLGLRGPLTDTQRQDLERVRQANQHLMALVNDILNFARVDAGQFEYQLNDVEFATIVADLEPLIGLQLVAKGIAFDHDGCAPQSGATDTPDRPHLLRVRAVRAGGPAPHAREPAGRGVGARDQPGPGSWHGRRHHGREHTGRGEHVHADAAARLTDPRLPPHTCLAHPTRTTARQPSAASLAARTSRHTQGQP